MCFDGCRHVSGFLAMAGLLISSTLTFGQSPPPNDDFASATVIPAFPYTNSVDTRFATPGDNDPNCFGPGPTVWYKFRASENGWVSFDTSASDYNPVVLPGIKSDGKFVNFGCGWGYALEARAGHTYYLNVGSFHSSTGGHLVFHATEVAAPKV